MDTQIVYIVTQYGCNSTPSDMWTPISNIFTDYEEAYTYFLKISPSLHDNDNIAKQYIHSKYNEEDYLSKDYIMIENRVQLAGYPERTDEGYYFAKRPEGAVIARSFINNRESS